MRLVTGVTTVSSAGTRVQLNNVTNRVKFIKAKALAGNSGLVYLGISTVSATTGYELGANQELTISFSPLGGRVSASHLWVDAATNNDKISWYMVLSG